MFIFRKKDLIGSRKRPKTTKKKKKNKSKIAFTSIYKEARRLDTEFKQAIM